MSSFSAILSSLQDGKTGSAIESSKHTGPTKPTVQINTNSRPKLAAVVQTCLKRKAEAPVENTARKAIKVDSAIASRLSQPVQAAKPTAKVAAVSTTASKVKPANTSTTTQNAQPVSESTTSAAAKPRSFAALMAKASAAQEASRAAGTGTIKHKPTGQLSRKDRLRMIEEAKRNAKQNKAAGRNKGTTTTNGLKSVGTTVRVNGTNGVVAKRPRQELAYSGTMRAHSSAKIKPDIKRKGLGQDKYGGYASWDDLDDAEDEEEDYESGSDMEVAGFEEMEREEAYASRLARQEDQQALEEEERHKQEKLERKKRLMALSNTAAAAKKKY